MVYMISGLVLIVLTSHSVGHLFGYLTQGFCIEFSLSPVGRGKWKFPPDTFTFTAQLVA